MVREILAHLPSDAAVDGLVIVGGCALNVRVNSRLAGAFPHLPVHVPAVNMRKLIGFL
jgi:predicted NodU family carbamoyl transferase